MKLSSQIKPISYLKAHAAEIVRNLSGQGAPLIITQNGNVYVVVIADGRRDMQALLQRRLLQA